METTTGPRELTLAELDTMTEDELAEAINTHRARMPRPFYGFTYAPKQVWHTQVGVQGGHLCGAAADDTRQDAEFLAGDENSVRAVSVIEQPDRARVEWLIRELWGSHGADAEAAFKQILRLLGYDA